MHTRARLLTLAAGLLLAPAGHAVASGAAAAQPYPAADSCRVSTLEDPITQTRTCRFTATAPGGWQLSRPVGGLGVFAGYAPANTMVRVVRAGMVVHQGERSAECRDGVIRRGDQVTVTIQQHSRTHVEDLDLAAGVGHGCMTSSTSSSPARATPRETAAISSFAYVAGDPGGGYVLASTPVVAYGSHSITPTGRTLTLTVNDTVVPDGKTVMIGVHGIGVSSWRCVTLGTPTRWTVPAPGRAVTVYFPGGAYRSRGSGSGCTADAIVGTIDVHS
jgi:hypothetical protein